MNNQNPDTTANNSIRDIKQRVEEIGIFYEQTTLTPMEARVFALLLLADPPEMDFFAIQDFLQASKSTISNALKRLMNEGRVDYITKPGDRKRYFRVSVLRWLEQIQESFASVGPFVSTLNKVIDLRKDTNSPEFNRELLYIKDYFLFLKEELPRIQAKWNERKRSAD
ncbi:DNA-binding transcriptional regulator GbsR (MarR family) [Lewinella aquimaris]|uniref:DNA-binding transcriptional regulator GbsR (MarR family) n=1 Tax=Neolewinella aquimaris TaxID=1835722 RepID=A0A840EA56_9BACT|nr:helix-turn-helix domain-containing protein [Neolewinella aquimaris]MBB4080435.1 DNA-binding transcriptional regulator GbsR (MarR family) [Neolewinella aquimaris]